MTGNHTSSATVAGRLRSLRPPNLPAAVTLIGSLALLGAALTGLLFSPPAAQLPAPGADADFDRGYDLHASSSRAGPGQASVSPAQIAALHLFGESAAAAAIEPPEEVPETRLELELKGILIKGGDSDGAIIAISPTEQKNYRPGDTIIKGTTLHRITATQVIIKRAGRFESLSIPQHRLPDLTGFPATPTPDSAANPKPPHYAAL